MLIYSEEFVPYRDTVKFESKQCVSRQNRENWQSVHVKISNSHVFHAMVILKTFARFPENTLEGKLLVMLQRVILQFNQKGHLSQGFPWERFENFRKVNFQNIIFKSFYV